MKHSKGVGHGPSKVMFVWCFRDMELLRLAVRELFPLGMAGIRAWPALCEFNDLCVCVWVRICLLVVIGGDIKC